jgi:hypothetical protein
MVLYGSASLVRTFTNRGLDWSRSRVSLPGEASGVGYLQHSMPKPQMWGGFSSG